MGVENTLAKARYHLDNMLGANDHQTFEFELNSFLSTINSIPEHLLEHYNRKYSINIPDHEWLISTFLEKAKENGNTQAIRFFQWWNSEYQRIKDDPMFSHFIGKRHVSIHRRVVEVSKGTDVRIVAPINIVLSYEVRDSEGNLIKRGVSSKPHLKKEEPEISTHYYFEEFPADNIIDLCEQIYVEMETLIDNAHIQFP